MAVAPSTGDSGGGTTVGVGSSTTANKSTTPVGSGGTAAPAGGVTPTFTSDFTLKTQGWYITAGILVSVALANTPVGPLLLGVLGVALLFQISQLVQGK